MNIRLFKALFLSILFLSTIQEAVSKPDLDSASDLGNSIVCPTLLPLYNNTINVCGANITIPNPTSGDPNCTILSVINDYNFTIDASDFYPVGMTTVTFTVALSNGVVLQCSVDVNVDDSQAPTVVCPPVPPISCDISELPIFPNGTAGALAFIAAGGILFDNCALDSTTFIYDGDVVTTPPGVCPQQVVRTYRIFDTDGQDASCQQMVTINDVTPPTITCPDDVSLSTMDCSLAVVIPVPTTNDNCGTVTVTNDVTGNPNASGNYPVGTTPVTYTVTDACGNTTTCSFNVVVTESVVPTAICQDITVDIGALGTGTFTPQDIDNGSNDNCDMMPIIMASESMVDCNDIGTPITVVLTVTDASGNTATCESTVTAEDNINPVITCPPTIMGDCDISTVAPYADIAAFVAAGGTASDNCALGGISVFSEMSDGNTCPETVTRVYEVTDASGNAATCSQTIILDDNTMPTFDVPADISVECDQALTPAITGEVTNQADNCAAAAELVIAFTDSANTTLSCNNHFFFIRTWSVTDLCDNTSTADQRIEVDDSTGPTFDLPVDVTVECGGSTDEADTGTITNIADNCSATGVLTITVSDSAPTSLNCVNFFVEFFERSWSVTDECGRTTTLSQRITIIDTTPPAVDGTPTPLPDIACDVAFPAFEALTGTDNCSAVTMITEQIFTADVCAGYPVTYRWTPVDDCGNMGTPVEVVFNVLADTDVPVFTCEAERVFSTTPGDCSAESLLVPTPSVTDNCSGIVVTNDYTATTGDITADFPIGSTTVTWTATDDCGLIAVCAQEIIIEDQEPPTCAADGLTICLDGNGEGIVNATSLFDEAGSSDNCTAPADLTPLVFRMEDNCNMADDLLEGPSISVCCADIGSTIMVVVRVYDEAGNFNDCMVNINVCDELDPEFDDTTCLPDLTISCEFEFDLNDLAASFGNYIEAGSTAQSYTVESNPMFSDGFVSDNCSVTVSETMASDLECAQGTITRTFTITDQSNNTNTKQQVITIEDVDPFVCDDVSWPDDYEILNMCISSSPDSTLTGSPNFPEDKCTMIGKTFTDEIFEEPTSGCILIVRTWQVIDWCQYVPNSGDDTGLCENTQNITVVNTIDPVVTSCDPITYCVDEVTCIADLNVSATATDDCTDEEDFWWSYSIADEDGNVVGSGSGNEISEHYPKGEYTITWTVDDRCGNFGSCDQALTIRDCKDPAAVCLNGMTINLQEMPMGIMAMVWAKDFDISSNDNCTAQEDLLFSFSADTNETSIAFTCSNLGRNEIELWVTDECGNQSFCKTYIEVQDNFNFCSGCECDVSEYTGMAVVTCNVNFPTTSEPVAKIYNTRNNSQAQGGEDWGQVAPIANEISTPNWTYDEIGPVFGIAIDHKMSVYLAASDIYNSSVVPGSVTSSYPPAQIYKASPPSFNALPWVTLPNTGGRLNGIGNIVYDELNDQMFASNLEDGKIYRIDNSGTILDSYDPFNLDDGVSGIVVQDEQIWGLGLNEENGTSVIYFARIKNDGGREMYSLELIGGLFPAPGSEVVKISSIPGIVPRISDIAFSQDGTKMLVTERGLNRLDEYVIGTLPLERGTNFLTAHVSQTLAYELNGGIWELAQKPDGSQRFHIGGNSRIDGFNSAGGLDFGFAEQDGIVNYECDSLIWNSGNYLSNFVVNEMVISSTSIYGIQGVRYSGNLSGREPNGNIVSDLYIDFDGDIRSTALQSKGSIGDVEIFGCGTAELSLGPIAISGRVMTQENEEMIDVAVSLETETEQLIDMTSDKGEYTFNDLLSNGDYKLQANKQDEYLNGVSTLDIVMIQRHVLGLHALEDAYDVIAADVNKSDGVDGIDLILIRKLILGIDQEFSEVPSWQFIDANHPFIDQLIPWNYPTNMSMYDLDHTAQNMNFIGVKMGDVNATVDLGLDGQNIDVRNKPFGLDLKVERADLNILVSENISTYGFQIVFSGVSSQEVSLSSDYFDLSQSNYYVSNGNLVVSCSSPRAITLNASDVLFTIENNTQDLVLSSDRINSEIYTSNLEVYDVVINRGEDIVEEFEIAQNHPNPFSSFTDIDIEIPEEGNVVINIIDLSGKALYSNKMFLLAGQNRIRVDESMIRGYKGMLYYTIEYDGVIKTKSFIKI